MDRYRYRYRYNDIGLTHSYPPLSPFWSATQNYTYGVVCVECLPYSDKPWEL